MRESASARRFAASAAAEQVNSAATGLSVQSETLRGKVETFLAGIKAA